MISLYKLITQCLREEINTFCDHLSIPQNSFDFLIIILNIYLLTIQKKNVSSQFAIFSF